MGFLPSVSVPDGDYLLNRSTVEAAMAANARSEAAAAAHHRIANCYIAKLFAGPTDDRPDDVPVSARSGDVALTTLRFADVTSVPENDELNGLLRKLL